MNNLDICYVLHIWCGCFCANLQKHDFLSVRYLTVIQGLPNHFLLPTSKLTRISIYVWQLASLTIWHVRVVWCLDCFRFLFLLFEKLRARQSARLLQLPMFCLHFDISRIIFCISSSTFFLQILTSASIKLGTYGKKLNRTTILDVTNI